MASTSRKSLPLKKGVTKEFLDLFHHLIQNHDLGQANKLNLFCLRISNNKFS
jgi:hypothetical protein